MNIKNVNFHQILRPLVPERNFGPQDGFQNGLRSAQDGSKRLLEINFFALQNRLNFLFVLDTILVDFGGPKWVQKLYGLLQIGSCYRSSICMSFGLLSRRPERRLRGPESSQEAFKSARETSKRRPRGPKTPQERPKRLQEAPKSAPGGTKRSPKGFKKRRAH